MSKAPLVQEAVGKNPADRGKNGSKRHLLVDGAGVPLVLAVTGANRHDVSRPEAALEIVVLRGVHSPYQGPQTGKNGRAEHCRI
jgi:hypothetical protein